MPLLIGLVGVEGSGKSRVANALRKALPQHDFLVIDGYANKLGKALEMPLGPTSPYIANVHIATAREQELRKAMLAQRNIIVCGTMFDTLCHTGYYVELMREQPVPQNENRDLQRELMWAQSLAIMTVDTLPSLTHAFYLPVTDPDLLLPYPLKKNEEPGVPHALDKIYQLANRKYNDFAKTLLGSVNSKVDQIVKDLNDGDNSVGAGSADLTVRSGEGSSS